MPQLELIESEFDNVPLFMPWPTENSATADPLSERDLKMLRLLKAGLQLSAMSIFGWSVPQQIDYTCPNASLQRILDAADESDNWLRMLENSMWRGRVK